jgi:molybdopterin synthase sulfur carrier subunit
MAPDIAGEGNRQVFGRPGSGCGSRVKSMAIVRFFASARVAAGTGRDEVPGDTVADVLSGTVHRYGPGFADVLSGCKIWVNGEPAEPGDPIGPDDELAVLPPVSGGA